MLTCMGEGFSTGVQQATVLAPYRDQVRQAGLEAWAKLEEGPTESPIAGTMKRLWEPLPDFITHVQTSLERKFPPIGLRDPNS